MGMNRWSLYEALKGNRNIEKSKIPKDIYSMSNIEIREGVIEYLLTLDNKPRQEDALIANK